MYRPVNPDENGLFENFTIDKSFPASLYIATANIGSVWKLPLNAAMFYWSCHIRFPVFSPISCHCLADTFLQAFSLLEWICLEATTASNISDRSTYHWIKESSNGIFVFGLVSKTSCHEFQTLYNSFETKVHTVVRSLTKRMTGCGLESTNICRQLQFIGYFSHQESVDFGRKATLPFIFFPQNTPCTSEMTFDGMRANPAQSKVRGMSPDRPIETDAEVASSRAHALRQQCLSIP
jgi:hypothetical protein